MARSTSIHPGFGEFIALIFIILALSACAGTSSITPSTDATSEEADDYSRRDTHDCDSSLTFSAHSRVDEDGCSVLDGQATVTDSRRREVARGWFVNDLRHGEWHYFDVNGNKTTTELWINGSLKETKGVHIRDYSGFGFTGGWREVSWNEGSNFFVLCIVQAPIKASDSTRVTLSQKLFTAPQSLLIRTIIQPAIDESGGQSPELKIRAALNNEYGDVIAQVFFQVGR